jgi:hypothetical protein
MQSMIRVIASTALFSILAGTGFSQTPAVDQAYFSRTGLIMIMTPRLTLLDTPSQFVEMQFIAQCPKAPDNTAPRITMSLFSRALRPLYAKDIDRSLTVVADEQSASLGLLTYESLPEVENSVRDIYARSGPYNLTERIPTPNTTQIKKINSEQFLTAEIMSTRLLPLDFINRIASVRRLEIKLGGATTILDQKQLSVLREFAASVNLPDQNAVVADAEPTAKFSDLPPLDLSTASLDATMDWLTKAVKISGQIISPQDVPSRFEITETAGCSLTARLGGRKTFRPYEIVSYSPALEITADLAHLNPDLVRIDETKRYAQVFLVRMNDEPALVVRSRQGGTEKISIENKSSVASLILRKDGSAGPIRDALVHAIRVCRSPQR